MCATDKTALIGFTKRWGTPLEVQNGQCLTCHEGGARIVSFVTFGRAPALGDRW